MSEPKHYPLSCSGSARWIACPGSIELEKKAPPEKPSPYAEEGTKAHSIVEYCLLNWVEPIDQLDKGPMEMLEAAQVYTDYVFGKCSRLDYVLGNVLMGVEDKFKLGWIDKDLGGTNDCWIYDTRTKTLEIIDYKHGQGVVVEAEWNTQIMIYALGALQSLAVEGHEVHNVLLTIVQPRAYHVEGPIRSWEISAKQLMFWALNVLKVAAINTKNPEAPLNPGSHCRFCNAKAICPKLIGTAQEMARTDFSDPVLPRPEDLDPETVLKVLNFSEVFKTWSEDVKHFVLHQMKTGQHTYPGFKLVKTTKHRKWSDEHAAEQVLISVVGEEAYSKKLITIAQAEKVLKRKNISAEVTLNGLWEKPEGDLTVAPMSDKRKEVTIDLELDFPDDDKEDWYD